MAARERRRRVGPLEEQVDLALHRGDGAKQIALEAQVIEHVPRDFLKQRRMRRGHRGLLGGREQIAQRARGAFSEKLGWRRQLDGQVLAVFGRKSANAALRVVEHTLVERLGEISLLGLVAAHGQDALPVALDRLSQLACSSLSERRLALERLANARV